ncbi:MAG: redoxin domain-containing protein [Armatimonadetes bacterium]|nr:redoxin domain-containing protein [Armatimonadota bacterium]
MRPNLIVYGSPTCEDTAITRDRLDVLSVPYEYIDIDADPASARYVESLNQGRPKTPTLVYGKEEIVQTEPTLDEMESALSRAGFEFEPRLPAVYPAGGLPTPEFDLRDPDGQAMRLSDAGRPSVLFFIHSRGCLTCAGYARQLAGIRGALDRAQAKLRIVLEGSLEEAAAWSEEYIGGLPVYTDPEGAAKLSLTGHFAVTWAGAFLLITDSRGDARIGAFATDAGGLIPPGEIMNRLSTL